MKLIRQSFKWLLPVVVLLAAWVPASASACAACYGKSDSALAQGMNWGIFTLLGVVITVLGSIACFFIYIIRKETAALKETPPQPQPEV